MSKQKFWILALRKKPDSEKMEVIVVSSDYVPQKDESLQVLSLSKKKSLLDSLNKPKLKREWGCPGLINPENPCGICLGSGDKRRIIEKATGNKKIWENEQIIAGKGKWRFYVFSDGDQGDYR